MHKFDVSSNITKIKPHYAIHAVTNNSNPTYPLCSFNGSQLQSLYNIPVVTKTSSRQVKIAIVVAYSWAKNVQSDLNIYWKSLTNFGPSATVPTINIYTMPGASQSASLSSGWNVEECLDVQMMATVNPNAEIWVVEAKSDMNADMNAAVFYATNTLNADVISCSWGGPDSTTLYSDNMLFVNPTSPSNFKCFCVSSGDNNSVCWPAVLSNVIAVGGTTLFWTPTVGNPINRTEYTWSSAGCGYSTSVAKPAYQNNVNTNKNRAIPDVSLIANTQNGVNIVCNGKWMTIGGTSASCPLFAGVLSLANQMRFNKGKVPLTTVHTPNPMSNNSPMVTYPTNVQKYLYNVVYKDPVLYSKCLYNITMGTDGIYSANVGYNIATGLGSPNVTNICDALLNL